MLCLVKETCSNLTAKVSSCSNHHSSKKPSKSIPRMKQDFFTYLPSEIVIDILSRLPIRTIVSSKCVCKSWLHLLKTDEFVNSHLAKSVPGLAVFMPGRDSYLCTFELKDGLNLERHDLHYKPLTKFDFPHYVLILGSANGLLLLYKLSLHHKGLYVCNPITHDYIELPCPEEFDCSRYPQVVTMGFGVSKITGQHKVVWIFNDYINAKYECHVHTLGTGSWRSIERGAPCKYNFPMYGAFLNGNLHWTVSDSTGATWISCFDLETERFSTFSTPPLGSSEFLGGLSALGDHLCLCDNAFEGEIVIWLMKEYGVDESLTEEYVISPKPELKWRGSETVHLIKVFRDGDVLMLWEYMWLFYYSSKTETTERVIMFERLGSDSILLTPSLLSLRSLGMENVISF